MSRSAYRHSREQQIKSGLHASGSRRFRCRVCERIYTPELMQSVVDVAPHAAHYYSDALNTYRELCRWGAHQAMYDKSETYSVEAVNADLRHYLARLGRRSRCFSRCPARAQARGCPVRALPQRAATA